MKTIICGEDNKKEALRWGINEMRKGFKTVRNKKYLFTDCLKMGFNY